MLWSAAARHAVGPHIRIQIRIQIRILILTLAHFLSLRLRHIDGVEIGILSHRHVLLWIAAASGMATKLLLLWWCRWLRL